MNNKLYNIPLARIISISKLIIKSSILFGFFSHNTDG